MTECRFIDILRRTASQAGVNLTPEQLRQCDLHRRLLLEWNRKVNLTRITDPEEMAVKHFLDSFLPAERLPREGRVLDVGSGAGFPGVPLKVLHPSLDVTLLEARRKKASFLKVLVARLGLKGLRAVQGRWEDFSASGGFGNEGGFRGVILRALELEERQLARWAPGILGSGGFLAWWAGPQATPPSVDRTGGGGFLALRERFEYRLPRGGGGRQLFVWQRSP